MPPKRKASTTAPEGCFVFVLTLESICHSGDPQTPKIVGVYNSKEAAAACAGEIDSLYGSFEYGVENDFAHAHEDHRKNPPDSGVLMQLGSRDYGEGDMEILTIEKCAILGMSFSSKKKKK